MSAIDLTSAVEEIAKDETLTPANLISRIADGKLRAFSGTVDLEAVYRQTVKITEAGISRAEIIQA